MSKDLNYSEMARTGVLAAQEAAHIVEQVGAESNIPQAQIDAAKSVAIGTVASQSVSAMLKR